MVKSSLYSFLLQARVSFEHYVNSFIEKAIKFAFAFSSFSYFLIHKDFIPSLFTYKAEGLESSWATDE